MIYNERIHLASRVRETQKQNIIRIGIHTCDEFEYVQIFNRNIVTMVHDIIIIILFIYSVDFKAKERKVVMI